MSKILHHLDPDGNPHSFVSTFNVLGTAFLENVFRLLKTPEVLSVATVARSTTSRFGACLHKGITYSNTQNTCSYEMQLLARV